MQKERLVLGRCMLALELLRRAFAWKTQENVAERRLAWNAPLVVVAGSGYGWNEEDCEYR